MSSPAANPSEAEAVLEETGHQGPSPILSCPVSVLSEIKIYLDSPPVSVRVIETVFPEDMDCEHREGRCSFKAHEC